MEKAKLELVVGVFVLVGIVCLGYLSIKRATVEIAGVEVGRVKGIALNGDRGVVTLAIRNDVKLYDDTIASIKTRGIIGEKYVSLSIGGSGEILRAGGRIRDTESGLDLEELVSQYIHGKVK